MSKRKTTYDVNPYLVGELFKGHHNFRIPEFQRSYVWSADDNPKRDREVNLLLEDMLSASAQNENYYIGSIITYPGTHYEHLLVDGQQRITTLQILLIAFRDFQKSLDIEDNEKNLDVLKMIKFKQDTGKEEKIIHKLKVSNSIGQNYFYNLVEEQSELNTVEAGSREMSDAYKACFKFLSDIGHSEAKDFINYICDSVEISWIEASDIASAFIVFERMNDRGKDLTVSEKFKYLLFQNSDSDQLHQENSSINKEWEFMTTKLSEYEKSQKPKMDRFLSYFLASRFYEDEYPTTRGMINWIRTENNMKLIGLSNPSKLLKLMQKDLSCYGNFLLGLNIDGSPNENLLKIKKYASDVRQHIPVLLASTINRPSKEEFNELTEAIERLTFALKISGAQWNRIEKNIPKWCSYLRREDSKIHVFIEKFIQPEIEERALELSVNLSDTTQMNPSSLKFILEKANEILCIESYEPILKSTSEGRENAVTIEHILPQNFSANSAKSKLELSKLKKSINRLGNLTLLERVSNSSAGNLDVSEKFEREIFKESKFLISRVLQVQNFSGQNAHGPKHKKVFNKFFISEIVLEDGKYWNLDHILQREKMYFALLSQYFKTEIKSISE